MHAVFLPDGEGTDWRDIESLSVGTSSSDASVVAQVGISINSGQALRVDVQANVGYSCFRDVRCVAGIVYIGFGECIFVVRPNERSNEAHSLEGYFGHLYTAEELEAPLHEFAVLAASASELLSFSIEGKLLWRTGNLAIDGVVVDAVKSGVVSGSGEWNPPGGWRPFNLSSSTGEQNVA